ncbi:toll/interleukin-1 receptor domain-containing protein [Amycolatopsis magusensis]|uniref:TIR domain-containing protein n=1 Tax=Amycolatopsis magusensis TaxID=882444 RepID=A0ABS4Q363_9PSEU|nr:toll/interleukin-1 receptor domain-containing protein [Amycolatopsis magusensis]MBP2186127.1 hypothetical protein [Amycolatopsis magusensis]
MNQGKDGDELTMRHVAVDNDVSVFVSYAHKDDESSHGRVKKLAEGIADTYASLTGLTVGIFFDTDSIRLGENWRDRIRAGLNNATVLLAFISPSYLRSRACREELASFFAFLPSQQGRKLVIPILLFPQERIERYFSSDDLWSEIQELQWKDASGLRSEEPGSPTWMLAIAQISERIEESLIEQEKIDTSSTLIATDSEGDYDDTEHTEGTLEKISRAEEELPRVNSLATAYGERLNTFNELIEGATIRLKKASSFGQRLALSKELATALKPLVDDSYDISDELRDAIQRTSPGIISIIRMVGSSGEATDPTAEDVQDFLRMIRSLANEALKAVANVEQMMHSIEGGKGMSSDLDKIWNRMNAGLLMFFESRSHYKSWLEELDRIAPDN